MRTAAFLYPWDVVGDPGAADRLAGLGIQQVTLASAYHSTRALTPRHPRHRIVTARHSAVLYPPDPARWAGRTLRPAAQDWTAGPDPFGAAARALADAGLEAHTWVVLAHNSRLGAEHPAAVVRNAYGDPYPWAPCIARPEVREYLVDLAAEAAVRPGARGTELESCGWYGLAHLHAHDKTGGVPLTGAAQYLMSVCFCTVCAAGYTRLGVPAQEVRAAVVRALEPQWSAGRAGPGGREGEWAAVEGLLGAELAGLLRSWRDGAARTLQRAAVRAVRDAAADGFRVLLHADPAAHRCGANVGVDPADVLAHADGVVLPCTGDAAARADVLGPFADRRAGGADCPAGGADRPAGLADCSAGAVAAAGASVAAPGASASTIAANFTVVSGLGGSPGTLAADAAHAASLGATELRLYHAGLASDRDLAAVGDALREIGDNSGKRTAC
ncbi:hypothetical protein [Streptomyces hygroscopicus]|uniref:hypothetical protein n=1 Tax=Streptomyces hygroscopicus TaxID=1912 RepID=UPI001FCAD2FD|nr:hypothetical protein [Streptomyces hygroscopicus]BDH10941.1 hypothetical protein HOK021_21200 [Streptomyces hygroscopicus]